MMSRRASESSIVLAPRVWSEMTNNAAHFEIRMASSKLRQIKTFYIHCDNRF